MGLFDRENNGQLEQLLQKHRHDAVISNEARNRMKGHIFSQIKIKASESQVSQVSHDTEFVPSGIFRFLSYIRSSAGAIFPDAVTRSRMKERIFAKITEQISAIRPFSFHIFSLRKSLSLAMILIFGTVTFVFFQPQPTFARKLTTLEVVKGEVSVLRQGKVLPVSSEITLLEGDVLTTGSDGEAVIHYFDDSFSRLFSNTKIQFQTLQSQEDTSSMTVKVDVNTGKMWSHVFDLVSDSQFTVQAKGLIASVYYRATFIVSAQEKKSSVQVISSAVNVKSVRDLSKSKPVIKGFQAVVAENGISSRSPAVAPLRLKEDEKRWVETNLQKDEQLIAKVEQEKIEQPKIDEKIQQSAPTDVLQQDDSSPLFLSFDAVEKAKVSLLLAQRQFEEAVSFLSEGQDFIDQGSSEIAEERLRQFEEKILAAEDGLKVFESYSAQSGLGQFEQFTESAQSDSLSPFALLVEKIENSKKLHVLLKTRIASSVSVEPLSVEPSLESTQSTSLQTTDSGVPENLRDSIAQESQPVSTDFKTVPETAGSPESEAVPDNSVLPENTVPVLPAEEPKVLPPDVLLPKLQLPRR